MKKKLYNRYKALVLVTIGFLFTNCKKLIEIEAPISTISTEQVFGNDEQAKAAMAGAYTLLINASLSTSSNSIYSGFAAGLATHLGGMSSDEMISYNGIDPYNVNKLTIATAAYSPMLWNSAYKVIYAANAVIEGIQMSRTGALNEKLKIELDAEARFVRAFTYFYLVNFFGDVPLVLTVDFNQTARMARTPKEEVYQQMVEDLMQAEAILPEDFSAGNGQRIIPNKWAAKALLSRIYLYQKDYELAEQQASAIINNQSQYHLEADLNRIFLTNSSEAIWQLQQDVRITALGNATPEGGTSIPIIRNGYVNPPNKVLSAQLINSFEPGDLRRTKWIDSAITTADNRKVLYPYKYKIGPNNFQVNGNPTEYYMVLRLAEQYLIRAEAQANGAGGGATAAVNDLNVLRRRAGLDDLTISLNNEELMTAIMHERQIELFGEWGHRWFDLIRTGRAVNVLSAIPSKQPWLGAYQLLYPIPPNEIINNSRLTQNPDYQN